MREVSRKTKYGFSVRSDGWQEKFRRQGRYNKEESIELKLGRGELGKKTQAVRHENNRKCSKEVRPNTVTIGKRDFVNMGECSEKFVMV